MARNLTRAERQESDIPHGAELAKEVEEFLWGDVEAAEGSAHGKSDSSSSD